jgi:cytochrome c553
MRKLAAITIFLVVILAACSSKDTGFKYSDLPSGDAARGADLFTQSVNGAAACSGCHTLTASDGVGPSLQNFAAVAGARVSGQTAEEYAFYSILQPSKSLRPGFSNIMPTDYEAKLSKQDIADLITYLMTLGASGTGSAAQQSGGGSRSVDTYMLVFRLIHIASAAFWFGAGLFTVLFFEPTARVMGADGQRFVHTFFKVTRFEIAMPVAAVLTTLAGVALYYRVSGHFNADWMSSTAGVTLSVGAVAGISAAAHGGAVIGPNTQKMAALADELAEQGTPLTDQQLALMRDLQRRARMHGLISAGLIAFAMICMISARYL